MKKFVEIALMFLLLSFTAKATTYYPGDTVYIMADVCDTLTGKPKDADTMNITVFQMMTTTQQLATTAMTKRADDTGKYYTKFVIPATPIRDYRVLFECFQDGRDTAYSWDVIIHVDTSLNVMAQILSDTTIDRLMKTVVTSYVTYGTFGDRIRVSDTAFYATLSNMADTLENSGRMLYLLSVYWGVAADSMKQIFYPVGGVTPKDSVIIMTKAGVAKMKVDYFHGVGSKVIDSIKIIMK
jgi:hypothetical protein